MRNGDVEKIAGWLTEQALAGASETELLCDFCERANAADLPLSSAIAVVDTLHPIWQGRVFSWRNDGQEEEPVLEYRSKREGEEADVWKKSGFYHLIQTGTPEVRRRIGFGDPVDFYGLDELRNHGHKDYLALVQRFASEATIGQDGCYFLPLDDTASPRVQ